jgi:hypothetical protein
MPTFRAMLISSVPGFALVIFLIAPRPAAALKVGDKAKPFQLKDAFGKTHTLASFKKRIFTVWYEGKQSTNQNKWLHDRIRLLRKRGLITDRNYDSIGIANYQETAIPNAILDVAVRYHAKKDRVTILLDRDGRMQRLWGFRNGRCNIFVFNKERRLIWKATGPLTRKRARQFIRMIRRLTR